MPTRSDRIRDAFLQALAMPLDERDSFLAGLASDDVALAAEVRSLLEHARSASQAGYPPTGGLMRNVLKLAPGDCLGPFRIQGHLGSGGAGDVYIATQASPHRDVALKVLRPGCDADMLQRFRLEGSALARLNHENIARVYAVGDCDGLPFLALELAQGLPITEYADAHRLTVAERLALFSKVCDAVEHVHQNGLIHRDLKPANVSVIDSPSGPVPKLVDFGLAKHASPSGWDPDGTAHGTVLGTLDYASPEQLRDSRSVDTRTDVYSAGIILFELLAGTLPLRAAELSIVEFIARTQRGHSTRPSQLLRASPALLESTARNRRVGPEQLLRQFESDLDYIIIKSIQSSPWERYATIGELRDDLRRHSEGWPVRARPANRLYSFRKAVRRHWRAAVVLSAVLVVAGLGLASTIRAERAASRRLGELESLATDLVSTVNEILDIPGALRAKHRLADAASRTLEEIGGSHRKPNFEARLAEAYECLGQLQGDPYSASLGLTGPGVAALWRAVTLRSRLLAADSSETNAAAFMRACFLTEVILQSGHPGPPRADSLLRTAMLVGERLVGRDSTRFEIAAGLSMVYDLHAEYLMAMGYWDATRQKLHEARQLRELLVRLRPGSDEAARLLAESRARESYASGNPARGVAEALAALETHERSYARRPYSYRALLDYSYACRATAYALERAALRDSALSLHRRCVRLRRMLAGSDSEDLRAQHQLANSLMWLSSGFLAAGHAESALVYARQAYMIGERNSRAVGAPGWAQDALNLHRRALARAMQGTGQSQRADSLYDVLSSGDGFSTPLEGLDVWRSRVEQAAGLRKQGRMTEARSCLDRAERVIRRAVVGLVEFSADATPCADAGLALLEQSRLTWTNRTRRRELLELAEGLPGLDVDQRGVRALVLNQLACALAEEGDVAAAGAKLELALRSRVAAEARGPLEDNLRLLKIPQPGLPARGKIPAGPPMRTEFPSNSPYDELAVVLGRMIVVWGELPVPAASRLKLSRS